MELKRSCYSLINSKMSGLSRNKLTTVSGPKRSAASSVLSGSRPSKLRSELRRVMSDRVLKITQCSKQQNVIKKDTLLNSTVVHGLSQNRMVLAASQQNQTIKSPPAQMAVKDTSKLISQETSPKFLSKLTDSANKTTNISPNAKLSNKITLEPIKTFDLKDKNSLRDHIVTLYDDVVRSQGSIVFAVQSIINSLTHYAEANQLDNKTNLHEMLKAHLFKTPIDLKQKYIDDELSDKLKLEGQLQVLLQIENYIIANVSATSGKVKVDDDWVWDIANSIRWLKQKFKDFKIERFLFGEIYASYFTQAPDFINSLMEELGYDKEDNGAESSSDTESPKKKSPLRAVASQSEPSDANKPKMVSSSAKFLSQLSSEPGSGVKLSSLLQEDSNSNFSVFGGVNSLFEEEEKPGNDFVELSEASNQPIEKEKDILDEFMKKKPVRKGDFHNTTINRSIVIQKKQRTKLKVRSPFKSPSKAFQKRHANRQSPRLKDRQILQTDTTSNKRPRTYLITDTPDHKQNATIITTRQEKLRKRFSFQQFANCASSPSVLPTVPDTPVKGREEPPLGSLFPFQKLNPSPSKAGYLSPQKMMMPIIYASPNKVYKTPQKTVVCGSPLKVFATPSPTKKLQSPLKVYATPSPTKKLSSLCTPPRQVFEASPARKSPAKRVIFR